MSNAILVVHHFIDMALRESCADDIVCTQLRMFITDDLTGTYGRAMDHANFLLSIECGDSTITCNPDFAASLQKNRKDRLDQRTAEVNEITYHSNSSKQTIPFLPKEKVLKMITATPAPVDQICQDVHELLKIYYGLARSRFVDAIYQQVVDHFLLSDGASALRVFGPHRVIEMTGEQLGMIAAEDASTRRTRERLGQEITSLERALVVLRT